MSLIIGGVTLAFWPKKLRKIAIFRNKLKDFEKSIRDEVMKWYFLNSPGQEEQFKLYFTPSLGFLKNFVPPHPLFITPSNNVPIIRDINVARCGVIWIV